MTTALIVKTPSGKFDLLHYVHDLNIITYIGTHEYESAAIGFCKRNEFFRNWHRV